MTFKALKYKLNKDLEYLEVIPCRPEIFLEFQQFRKDHDYPNIEVRFHFPSFEFYGTFDKFEFIINDMENAPLPETIKTFFPTNNVFLGIRTIENRISKGWWQVFKLFNLKSIRIDCRWDMLDWLVNHKDKILNSFPRLEAIEIRISQMYTTWGEAQQKLDKFVNVFVTETHVDLKFARWKFENAKFGGTACRAGTSSDIGDMMEDAKYICSKFPQNRPTIQ